MNPFQPIEINQLLTLQNRVVMAPLTRCFATGGIPTEAMAGYYGKRGDAGLIVSEATMVGPHSSGYPNTPGIWNKEQIRAWSHIVEKIEEKGGKLFSQLWDAGMMSHPLYREGNIPLSASQVGPKNKVIPRTKGKLLYPVPEQMSRNEMKQMAAQFVTAAKNALSAGCAGVELHAANGYLIDSFLHHYSNTRTDEYGGALENRARFPLELIDQVGHAIGWERLGLRLSPVPIPGMNNIEEDSRDQELFAYFLNELNLRKIAYVHASTDDDHNENGQLGMPVTTFLRRYFKGVLIGCGSYTPLKAEAALQEGRFDCISFGRLFIANPNLVILWREGKIHELKPFEGCLLGSLN